MGKARISLPVEIDNLDRGCVKRLVSRQVVAHVIDQLHIARGVRAVRLIDQEASIGGAIEHHPLSPGRRQWLVIAEHALPGGSGMWRLGQGGGQDNEGALAAAARGM